MLKDIGGGGRPLFFHEVTSSFFTWSHHFFYLVPPFFLERFSCSMVCQGLLGFLEVKSRVEAKLYQFWAGSEKSAKAKKRKEAISSSNVIHPPPPITPHHHHHHHHHHHIHHHHHQGDWHGWRGNIFQWIPWRRKSYRIQVFTAPTHHHHPHHRHHRHHRHHHQIWAEDGPMHPQQRLQLLGRDLRPGNK